jgi:hypothetical protein
MNPVMAARNELDRQIRHLIEDHAATRADLKDAGLTDYRARQWLDNVTPRPLTKTQVVAVPPLGLPATVALVPMNSLGRRYLRHDVYLRDASLHGQLRLRATHLGWSEDGRVVAVRPIERRWRIGSAQAIPITGVPNQAAIVAESDVHTAWPGLAALVQLGKPVPVGLPLGFGPNPKGGASAIPGVSHVLLTDLLTAASRGGTLKGTPTV